MQNASAFTHRCYHSGVINRKRQKIHLIMSIVNFVLQISRLEIRDDAKIKASDVSTNLRCSCDWYSSGKCNSVLHYRILSKLPPLRS